MTGGLRDRGGRAPMRPETRMLDGIDSRFGAARIGDLEGLRYTIRPAFASGARRRR